MDKVKPISQHAHAGVKRRVNEQNGLRSCAPTTHAQKHNNGDKKQKKHTMST